MKKLDKFDIIIVGTGGQGLITLIQILAEAAIMEGYDVKTSELHGLAQRGGSVECHIRFGKEIFSPLVRQGGADLVLALEAQEALKACYFASKKAKTFFLVNKFFVPIPGQNLLKKEDILKVIKKFSKKAIFIPAGDICEKEVGKSVVAGIFLISFSCFKGIIPLKPNSLFRAIERVIPKRYLDLNKKTFELTRKVSKAIKIS